MRGTCKSCKWHRNPGEASAFREQIELMKAILIDFK